MVDQSKSPTNETVSFENLTFDFSFFLYDVVILTIPLIRLVLFPNYSFDDLEKENPGMNFKLIISMTRMPFVWLENGEGYIPP